MNGLSKNKDFIAGLMFVAIGAAFWYGAGNYQLGSAARMGPGWFPSVLGAMMTLLGVLIAGVGLKNQAKWSATEGIGWTLKPVVTLTVAVVLFGFALPTLGMIVAIILLTIVSGTAAHDKNFKQLAMITVLMCVFCAAVFVWGLKLQMKLFPWS